VDHGHEHPHEGDLDPAGATHLDPTAPDSALAPGPLARRNFLQRAGLLGAGIAGASVLGATSAAAGVTPAESRRQSRRAPRHGYQWLAGDHHIHTQYSSDGMYRVADQTVHAAAFGLDWIVITDHGSVTHSRIGVEKVNPDIVAARAAFEDDVLVFQGFEWNIPGAEHGTVFVHPGKQEVAVLNEFEKSFDGTVNAWTDSTLDNERHALEGLDFQRSEEVIETATGRPRVVGRVHVDGQVPLAAEAGRVAGRPEHLRHGRALLREVAGIAVGRVVEVEDADADLVRMQTCHERLRGTGCNGPCCRTASSEPRLSRGGPELVSTLHRRSWRCPRSPCRRPG